MVTLLKPDTDRGVYNGIRVFLAGSIEMGKAEDWQSRVCKRFTEEMDDYEKLIVTFYNPRRDTWDPSWKQQEVERKFNFQVNWELNRLHDSDIIFMYIDPNTTSPITLLELGRFATSGKLIVCCPDGFYRKGNVEILCTRENIPFYADLETAMGALETKLRNRF